MSPSRLWLADDGRVRPVHGVDPGWSPTLPVDAGLLLTPEGPRWFAPIPGEDGLWLEGSAQAGSAGPETRSALDLLDHLLSVEREVARLSQELASRYEEIDLLYTISEILGQTVRLEQAARTIVRAVSSVVGARRASIMVIDEDQRVLRTVAAQGLPPGRAGLIPVGDPHSVAARVFREQRPLIGDPIEGTISSVGKEERGYQGVAFMSIPICYAAPGAQSRCIGVVNLTDRIGGDRFAPTDRKLVAAIANQIGAALENARLAEREREQERLERELELASRLQQSLLPSPAVLSGDAEVGVRCLSLESVGGDFYGFNRLGQGSIGVMVGDVSSHGFSAALLMASAVAAAGIHAAASAAPDQVLTSLRESLAEKLAPSDSYLTIFYARLDPSFGRLVYANAGHPHAFRVPAAGEPVRLEATAAPLGLAADRIGFRIVPWTRGSDLLCVWTDGLVEASNPEGERFGERRVLESILARRSEHPEAIVAHVMREVDRFAPAASDDRTLLVLKV
ncbi:MAG: GAF domain-containing SpoIIE family protein phosphatase [Gemmatimonadales bacterium]|nr:GAF domain-containing SpoIIE family protein phosphatase [Gemmatimonadales bacterium]